jgi:long-chain fatty acid transport protein
MTTYECSSSLRNAVSVLAFAGSLMAQGGGVAVYEVGTPNIGEAYAGQAAVADNASTAFLNPAGMTRLSGTQFLVGGQLDLLSATFKGRSSAAAPAGGSFVVPSVYFTKSIGERFSVGFSMNSPFGLGLSYPDGWEGRYVVQRIRLAVAEVSPSVAYRVNRWLSVGAAVSLERASVSQKTAVPNLFEPARGDGAIELQLHGWGAGFHTGALFAAGEHTRIGLTYRSEVDLSLNGGMFASNLGSKMMAVLPPLPTSRVPLALPQGANLSVVRELDLKVALMADVGWTNWRRFGQDRHWRDTWRSAVGLRWKANRRTTLHAGISLDTSPVLPIYRTPDLPVDRQRRFSAGVTRELSSGLSAAIACSYVDLGAARMDNSLATSGSRLSGVYNGARLPVISLSFLFHPSNPEWH